MQRLEELEQKVLAIVSRNKELGQQLAAAQKENDELQAKLASLEASLLKEAGNSTQLNDERQTICTTIDGLLESIDSLQAVEDHAE